MNLKEISFLKMVKIIGIYHTFRNSKIEIPDRIFEIKSLRKPFVNFENLIIEDDFITFDKIEIPKKFPIKRGEVVFTGRTTPEDILIDNKISFELKAVDGEDIPNKFTAKIPMTSQVLLKNMIFQLNLSTLMECQINLEFLKIILKKLSIEVNI